MDFVKSPLNWLTSTVVSATDVMHNAALYAAECVGSESSKSVTPAVNSVIFDSIGHKNTSSFLDMVRFGCHNFVSSVFRLHWAAVPFFWVGFASVVGYIGTILFQNLVLDLFPVNLKKKYGADWALVTGASSGKTHMHRFKKKIPFCILYPVLFCLFLKPMETSSLIFFSFQLRVSFLREE